MPHLETTTVCPSVTQSQRIYMKFCVGVLYNKLLSLLPFMTICADGAELLL